MQNGETKYNGNGWAAGLCDTRPHTTGDTGQLDLATPDEVQRERLGSRTLRHQAKTTGTAGQLDLATPDHIQRETAGQQDFATPDRIQQETLGSWT